MKTKILILSLISIFILSCKSDDDGSEQQNTQSKKLAETITTQDVMIEFSYNEDQSVREMDFSNATGTITFAYAEKRISTLKRGDDIWEFQYDTNGKVTSFSNGTIEINVTYNSAERSYTYEKQKGIVKTIILHENGDIKQYSTLNTQTNELVEYKYFYDNSKNGILTNSNSVVSYILMTLNYYDLGMFISKKPVKTFNHDDSQILTFENTYDDDDFIMKSTINGTTETFYSYTQ